MKERDDDDEEEESFHVGAELPPLTLLTTEVESSSSKSNEEANTETEERHLMPQIHTETITEVSILIPENTAISLSEEVSVVEVVVPAVVPSVVEEEATGTTLNVTTQDDEIEIYGICRYLCMPGWSRYAKEHQLRYRFDVWWHDKCQHYCCHYCCFGCCCYCCGCLEMLCPSCVERYNVRWNFHSWEEILFDCPCECCYCGCPAYMYY